ncbi:MAG: hypothetical protein CML60_10530 [Rhodobacteraceae bacterium]|nr:hypothetical protein [Paracoccaceae bacterium]MBT26812.1 hypothetical protein [Paracoccaceae bacterium]
MSFFLPDEDTQTAEVPVSQEPVATPAERRRAAAEMERIRTDNDNRSMQHELATVDWVSTRLGADFATSEKPDPRVTPREQRYDYLLSDVARAKAAEPEIYADLPETIEDLEAIVLAKRKAEYDDAASILARAPDGAWWHEFLGASWASMTDPEQLALMVGGASSGAGIMATVGIEAAMGALGEIVTLDDQYRVADDLDIEEPEPLKQIGLSAGLSGVVGGGLAALPRLLHYRKATTTAGQIPEGVSPGQHERRMDDTRRDLETGRLSHNADSPTQAGSAPLRFQDFDFSAAGNASPRTNRIGYVFGRLIERGMEPHVAAGFVGNFMVESGVGLDTRAVGDGGAALGLAQWNDRRAALLAYARSRGKDPHDLDVQIDFVFHELDTSEARAWSRIQGARNAIEAAEMVSRYYERPGTPHLSRRVGYARNLMDQYQIGTVPRWSGAMSEPAPAYAGYTSRGYTGTGQVQVGDDLRVDVDYQVVDLPQLRQASGDLQPRDRGRVASDAWVADTSARLDPAQLMPSPTADRGAPLVGPDNVIESGNGRVRAIARTYEQHPDRAAAYRQQIELITGAQIPEGMEQPVLIARRSTDLDGVTRRRMVVEAQDSGVARMTATERAQVGRRALSADLMARYQPGRKFSAPENRDFARAFAGSFPRSERNAFFDAKGVLSIDGVRQLDDAMFARAWDAEDILARYVETEAGELRSLMSALSDVAPDFALLRAEIEAGRIAPEMDITPFILDAVRLIVEARDIAAREGGKAAQILNELLEQVDLLEGAIAPLTAALVRHFMPAGRQAPADKIAAFLRRYVAEARKVGAVDGGLFDTPGPLDVLKAIDKDAFGDLAETGLARIRTQDMPDPAEMPEGAYVQGALSPEAEAADELARRQLETALNPDDALMTNLRDDLADLTDLEVKPWGEDGPSITIRAMLDELDADDTLEAVIDACTLGGRG